MVFSSNEFLLFFIPVLLILYFIPFGIKYKNFVLLIFSILFYGYGEPKFIFILFAEVMLVWLLALMINDSVARRRLYLIISIVVLVLLLFIYKYFNFIISIINNFLNGDNKIVTVSIILPIGISFYTFQLISYIVDVYRKRIKPTKNYFTLLLYTILFPQLIAGPIVRYKDIEHELDHRTNNLYDFTNGLTRFGIGLSKKVLIANNLAIIVDNTFTIFNNETISVASAWLGAILYTYQIYYDFSGYSDMAIGLGKIFGFKFPENFNYPYWSTSITDFWRKWHMTLTTWFRDYVYIPLGGNRCSKLKNITNIAIVWILTGIWHGANYTFIVWGLVFCIFLVLEKFVFINLNNYYVKQIYRLFVFIIIILNWVIFRSDNLGIAIKYLGNMFMFGSNMLVDNRFNLYINKSLHIIVLAIIFATPIIQSIKSKILKINVLNEYTVLEKIAALLSMLISIIFVINNTYNPFIYFNF